MSKKYYVCTVRNHKIRPARFWLDGSDKNYDRYHIIIHFLLDQLCNVMAIFLSHKTDLDIVCFIFYCLHDLLRCLLILICSSTLESV